MLSSNSWQCNYNLIPHFPSGLFIIACSLWLDCVILPCNLLLPNTDGGPVARQTSLFPLVWLMGTELVSTERQSRSACRRRANNTSKPPSHVHKNPILVKRDTAHKLGQIILRPRSSFKTSFSLEAKLNASNRHSSLFFLFSVVLTGLKDGRDLNLAFAALSRLSFAIKVLTETPFVFTTSGSFFWHFMANYLQSYFVRMLCSLCVPLANLYAHADFYSHNYINRICPKGETSRWGANQIYCFCRQELTVLHLLVVL